MQRSIKTRTVVFSYVTISVTSTQTRNRARPNP
nr:MAG TPA: hypothetical protein [Caudoviricetes sp.]